MAFKVDTTILGGTFGPNGPTPLTLPANPDGLTLEQAIAAHEAGGSQLWQSVDCDPCVDAFPVWGAARIGAGLFDAEDELQFGMGGNGRGFVVMQRKSDAEMTGVLCWLEALGGAPADPAPAQIAELQAQIAALQTAVTALQQG